MTHQEQLKSLIGAMKSGLKLAPHSTQEWVASTIVNGQLGFCPLMHAVYGVRGYVHGYSVAYKMWPVLLMQKVSGWYGDSKPKSLGVAIETLGGEYQWTTEQVIAWLQTHIE